MSKRVNLKIMDQINDKELNKLVENLKKIKDFEFFIDSQFMVNNNQTIVP